MLGASTQLQLNFNSTSIFVNIINQLASFYFLRFFGLPLRLVSRVIYLSFCAKIMGGGMARARRRASFCLVTSYSSLLKAINLSWLLL